MDNDHGHSPATISGALLLQQFSYTCQRLLPHNQAQSIDQIIDNLQAIRQLQDRMERRIREHDEALRGLAREELELLE